MMEICRLASTNGCKVYFLGTKESTLIKLSENLKQKYPSLDICGIQPLPFGELSEMGTDDIIETINRAKPDVLFVGMSAPKQEFWIKNNMDKVNAYLFAGIGAAFDFSSGEIPRAPLFLRSMGLEWAHRHIFDPKRKIGRPIKASPDYLYLIFILILLNHRALLKLYMLFRVLKDDGFFRFIGLAFKQVINYEKRYIWIKKFARELKPSSHLECKELDEETLLNLQYDRSIPYVDKFWNIAYGAQRCFGVYEGKNLIHFGWVYHSGCPRYDLKEGEAFLGPAITIKDFRRRGGQKQRLIHVGNLLRKEGCSKVYSATGIGNYPSINGLSSSDFRISHIQKRLLLFGKKIFSIER
jgi:exopolysaccharide biosynthesis WecB/TagA/CpsF family protein